MPIHEIDEEAHETIEPKSLLSHLPTPYGALNEKVMLATVKRNERITALDHFQDTRLITLELPADSKVKFSAGDVLLVQPANSASLVASFLAQIHVAPSKTFIIEGDKEQLG